MIHEEYARILPEAKTAVFFIHGILGTPNHFVSQIPLVDLVPGDWSVYNVLLDGHGGSVEEFSRSSMKKWKKQVFDIFHMLCRSHERVVIAAHSMGTLFGIQMALERPEKVAFLFLIASPMRPWVRLCGAVNCLRLVFGLIREDHPLEVATRNVCSVKTTRMLWKYIGWIPRYLELFGEIRYTEKRMAALAVPCVSYQSRKDELVSNLSSKVLARNGVVQLHHLRNSTHFYYDPEDQKTVRTDFVKRCKEITHD